MKRIDLDWNATTPLHPRVLERMLPYLREHGGNPSSLHASGRAARRAIEDARETIAAAIGCEAKEITFCSGATEANNLAVLGVAAEREGAVVLSSIEHPSVLSCGDALRGRGRRVVHLPSDSEGRVVPEAAVLEVGRQPALCAVMAVNNETGVVQPVDAVADACASAGVPLHVDAVQALGKIPFTVSRAGITSAAFSAHKIQGPKGVGALFVRSGTRISPQIVGGGQERGRRAGTENVAAIVGMAAAVENVVFGLVERRERTLAMEQALLDALGRLAVPHVRHGRGADRVPGTLNLRFPGVSGEGMLFGLDLLGIDVSLGSACSSGAAKPSHVLAAMGLSKVENLESVRISFGPDLSLLDVEKSAAAIAEVVRRSRGQGS